MKFVIHENKTFWGVVWHIITSDGNGHLEVSIDNDEDKTMYLCGLSVMPKYRNKGIGKALINIAELIAKDKKISNIKLEYEKIYESLHDYYSKLGYKKINSDNNYIYMGKKI